MKRPARGRSARIQVHLTLGEIIPYTLRCKRGYCDMIRLFRMCARHHLNIRKLPAVVEQSNKFRSLQIVSLVQPTLSQ